MVIRINDNLPKPFWPSGRVKYVHPGVDGMVRNVTVSKRLRNYYSVKVLYLYHNLDVISSPFGQKQIYLYLLIEKIR